MRNILETQEREELTINHVVLAGDVTYDTYALGQAVEISDGVAPSAERMAKKLIGHLGFNRETFALEAGQLPQAEVEVPGGQEVVTVPAYLVGLAERLEAHPLVDARTGELVTTQQAIGLLGHIASIFDGSGNGVHQPRPRQPIPRSELVEFVI